MPDSYLIRFINTQNDNIVCTISDMESTTDYIYELTGAGIILRNTNNDEDKFSPIRAMEAEISFVNTQQINLDTFSEGEEDRWLVSIAAGSDYLFKGYLQQDDIEEPFLPHGYNVVRLVASDGLGRLKDVKLNETPNGELDGVYTLAKYIAYALSPLGLQLDINIVNNLYEEDHDDRDVADEKCAFNQTFLDVRTFKTGATEFDDCYTVLEKILGHNYMITQHEHKWWVVRIDEYVRNYPFSYSTYDYTGVVSGSTIADKQFTGDQFYIENTIINKTDLEFINEDAVYQRVRPAKSVKLIYELEQYGEIPCNNNFENGDLVASFVGYKTYNVDDWTHGKKGADYITPAAATNDSYIRRNFDAGGLEEDRFVVLEYEPSSGVSVLKSCAIPVYEGDKFDLNFEWRLSADVGGSGTVYHGVAWITIEADDGTYWSINNGYGDIGDADGTWDQANVGFTTNPGYIADKHDRSSTDQSQWRTIEVKSNAVPRTGNCYIWLVNDEYNGTAADIYFKNLEFKYKVGSNAPVYGYIRRPDRPGQTGFSYTATRSQHHKISKSGNYLKQIEEQVYVSDSPRKIFKGALLKYDGSDYQVTESWSNYFDYATGSQAPPVIALGNYGKFQAFAVWNQNNFYQRKFRFNMSGLKRTPAVEGTATSGTTTSLTDTSKGWTVNQYAGYLLYFTGGTGEGDSMVIISNTSDTLTFTSTNAPDNTTEYKIELHPYISILHRMQVNTIGASHYFIFTDLERDLYLAEIRGTILEVRDSNLSYEVGDYDTHEFKYIV